MNNITNVEQKTVQQAAEYLGVQPGYVRFLVSKDILKKGRILGKKSYLIDNLSLRKFVERKRSRKGRPKSGQPQIKKNEEKQT